MIYLWNLHSNVFEDADVVSPIASQDIDDFVSHWHPPMDRVIKELQRKGIDTASNRAAHNVEDWHWKWPEKCISRAGALEWNSFALRCANKTQGLMFVNLMNRCKLPEQATQHLVYVDLVATAPWNRQRLVADPLYRGVGVLLITEAVLLSMQEGFDGRIGLHALPSSSSFYKGKLGMHDLGPDPHYQKLHYYEFTAAQAHEIIK